MLPKILLPVWTLAVTFITHSQKQWSNWYFNGQSMITFNTATGKGQFMTGYLPQTTSFTNYVNWSIPGTSYSDPTTGVMKFMIANGLAFDRNYNLINAPTLRMCSGDVYSIHIVPFSNNPNKFYIIQFQSRAADMLAASSGLQVRCPNGIGLAYSVFDLSLNGGLGNFQSVNNVVTSGLPERISVVKHSNGKDTWVIVHGWGNNTFYAYLFTDTGVQPPVISAIGPTISGIWSDALGHMVPSHNGKMLAAQKNGNAFLELYDFDNATGVLTNYRTVNNSKSVDRILFSPDDTKLYYIGNYQNTGIYQYDLNAINISNSLFKVANDRTKSYWQMQLGLDGRIYVSSVQEQSGDYFSVINCPNLPEYACNFEAKAIRALSYGLFPNFVNDYIQQPTAAPVTKFSLGNDTAICFGSHKLSAPPGWDSYKWNTGETTREITVTTPGNYYVLAGELGFSCPTAYGGITITNAAQPLSLGPDTSLCPGSTFGITVPSGFSNILWNDGTTDRPKMVSTSGQYALSALDQNGCRNWDTIYVGFKYYPRALFGPDTTLCNNQTFLLKMEPVPAYSNPPPVYLWQDGSTKDTFRVTKSGRYWGTVGFQGCTATDTVTVGYVNTQNVYLGADTSLCLGDSIKLNVNVPGISILWSTGATTSSIYIKNSGTYWVKVNNGSCTLSDTIKISFASPPPVTLGPDTTLCEGKKLFLSTNNTGATYLWQDGTTANNLTVSVAGTYWLQVTQNGCSIRDSVFVSYKLLPPVRLGGDTAICANASLLLNASHPDIAAYQWQDGSTQPLFLVKTAGRYYIQAIGINGCVNADTIAVNVNPLPVFSLPADTSICEGASLKLSVSLPGASYVWSNGSTLNSLTVTNAGLYWVDVNQGGCIKRDSVKVLTKPLPIVVLGADTSLCEGRTLLLNATNFGAAYSWQDQNTASSYLVLKPGKYSVIVHLNGCVEKDSITISYRYKPSFTLGGDTVLCAGTSFLLSPAVPGASLLWQNGSSAPSMLVTSPGIYRLEARNECGIFTDERVVTRTFCRLVMPSAFTPNNDGRNDVFKIGFPGFIKTYKLMVFNRWGELVYATANPFEGWDGKYKGITQPADNYVWTVTLVDNDGNSESAKGNVLIIR